MCRIKIVEPSKATGEVKRLLDGVKEELGMTPNMMKTLAVSPAALDAYLYFEKTIAAGSLDSKTRALIALAIAEANESEYCLSYNATKARIMGLSEFEIADGRRGISPQRKTHAALQFALKVLNLKGRVSNEDLKHLPHAGLTDCDVLEIIANVALCIFVNYTNLVAQTPLGFRRVEPLK